jgi:hypothetical protein
MQFTLRSAVDLYKHGGFLTQSLSEKDFNMYYDNRRVVVENNNFDTFYQTKPFLEKEKCILVRKMMRFHNKRFSLYSNIKSDLVSKTTYIKTCIRMLIRLLFQQPENFGFDIMDRNLCFEIMVSLDVKVSLNYISQQKSRLFIPHSVPNVPGVTELLEKVETKFPDFKKELVLRK